MLENIEYATYGKDDYVKSLVDNSIISMLCVLHPFTADLGALGADPSPVRPGGAVAGWGTGRIWRLGTP